MAAKRSTKEKGPKPTKPTEYMPGTKEKVEVMRRRYTKGQTLWHEADAGISHEEFYISTDRTRLLKDPRYE